MKKAIIKKTKKYKFSLTLNKGTEVFITEISGKLFAKISIDDVMTYPVQEKDFTYIENPTFKVSLVFEGVSTENPLEAAKEIVKWIMDIEGKDGGASKMTFDVVNESTNEAFTVDLAEEDEDAVLPNN